MNSASTVDPTAMMTPFMRFSDAHEYGRTDDPREIIKRFLTSLTWCIITLRCWDLSRKFLPIHATHAILLMQLDRFQLVFAYHVFLPIISKSRICNITYNNVNTVNYLLNFPEPYSQIPPIFSNCRRIIVSVSI